MSDCEEQRPPALKRRILSDALTPAVKAGASTLNPKQFRSWCSRLGCSPAFCNRSSGLPVCAKSFLAPGADRQSSWHITIHRNLPV